MDKSKLHFELAFSINGNEDRSVELLKSNGIAEKVFTEKLSEKPYTWMGNVCAVAVKTLCGHPIGVDVRKEYLEDNSISFPEALRRTPIAVINTLLVEIHRRVWDNCLKKQEVMCKYCTQTMIRDVELDKIVYLEDDQKKIDNGAVPETLIINLDDGFEFEAPKVLGSNEKKYEEYEGIVFNQFEFRIPELRDAVNNEKYVKDTIKFWRRVAFDCLIKVNRVEDGVVVDELPMEVIRLFGLKVYDSMLMGTDLKKIRTALREEIPTLPFAYYDECVCERKKEVPVAMEASNFFSE